MQQQMTLVSACITLFLVLDAPGNVPFFLSILKDVPPRRRRWVMIRELLIALGVLVAFLLGGRELLSIMQLRQEAISIGGGMGPGTADRMARHRGDPAGFHMAVQVAGRERARRHGTRDGHVADRAVGANDPGRRGSIPEGVGDIAYERCPTARAPRDSEC